jgi:23S rRNA pseudouridine955/2504/2580 synthase
MNIIVQINFPVRLDRYIKRLYPSLTQGMIEKNLRLKEIKLNGLKTLSSTRVHNGDNIWIKDSLNCVSTNKSSEVFSEAVITLSRKLLNEYLIFDHKNFIAINKPSGLATQGGSKVKLSICDSLSFLAQQELKLVHRLDKDTSGILIIAKGYESSAILADSFKNHLISKEYISVLEGVPKTLSGEIRSYMDKVKFSDGSDGVKDDLQSGKLAITKYKVIKTINNFTLVEFTPLTGRMHQLRLHALKIAGPIVGDKKYNSMISAKNSNMLLHACKMTIPKDVFGEQIEINAPIPNYISDFIS